MIDFSLVEEHLIQNIAKTDPGVDSLELFLKRLRDIKNVVQDHTVMQCQHLGDEHWFRDSFDLNRHFWLRMILMAEGTARDYYRRQNSTFDWRNALALCRRKNAEYGSDQLLCTGLAGIGVRCLDKLNRAIVMLSKGLTSSREPLEDTFSDLFNYCALALVLMDGKLGVEKK